MGSSAAKTRSDLITRLLAGKAACQLLRVVAMAVMDEAGTQMAAGDHGVEVDDRSGIEGSLQPCQKLRRIERLLLFQPIQEVEIRVR
ncbi:MAG: hypothetical protein O9309_16460 [Rhizobium sp.]|nr:hypothetical protein [Rhizobium sp.]MCZ8350032.1 hypothetical protein [Rhizobium sp.]